MDIITKNINWRNDTMLVETRKLSKKEVTVVTSLDVAETFGKEHKRVMQDIR